MMLEKMFEDKLVKIPLWGSTALHIFMGAVSALSNDPVNEMGFLSIILGALCIMAVITTSRHMPFIGPLLAVLIILIPGSLIRALVKMVLTGAIVMMFTAPAYAIIEILVTAFPFLFL